ncbi:hypothetical protein BH09MYX1_BH09MYX1_62360 [soil metagenome]
MSRFRVLAAVTVAFGFAAFCAACSDATGIVIRRPDASTLIDSSSDAQDDSTPASNGSPDATDGDIFKAPLDASWAADAQDPNAKDTGADAHDGSASTLACIKVPCSIGLSCCSNEASVDYGACAGPSGCK